MITLRPYQEKVVEKMLWAMNLEGNDLVTLAQGGGKSHIIAEFAKRLGKPVLILTPSKELLEQDLEKIRAAMPGEKIGVYSASMNSKEIEHITIGTIQSIHKNPEKFIGFDVVIVDECDLVSPKNIETSYRKLFIEAKIKKVFGLTGTPFRQDSFYERWGRASWMLRTITTTKMLNRYKGFFWSRMLTTINTHKLLEHGYLSPLEYHDVSMIEHEQLPTNKSQSDFDLEKYAEMMCNRYTTIAKYVAELPHKAKIVFCATIMQANELQQLIPGSMVVTSETSKKERESAVKSLKEGKLTTLLNVGIYTVGFDMPSLDCIVLLRPTRSLRLHCQILGRVARIAEGKTAGHVYDFVNNIKSMGKLEDIKIVKIDNKWNVVSPSRPDGFHMAKMYSYQMKRSEE